MLGFGLQPEPEAKLSFTSRHFSNHLNVHLYCSRKNPSPPITYTFTWSKVQNPTLSRPIDPSKTSSLPPIIWHPFHSHGTGSAGIKSILGSPLEFPGWNVLSGKQDTFTFEQNVRTHGWRMNGSFCRWKYGTYVRNGDECRFWLRDLIATWLLRVMYTFVPIST